MTRVFLRSSARRDLVTHSVYWAELAGDEVADRFLRHAQASFEDLAAQPAMGAPLALRRAELAGLRKWRVREFDDLLIFYLPRRDGVSIVRVLHASRDWWQLLGIDAV